MRNRIGWALVITAFALVAVTQYLIQRYPSQWEMEREAREWTEARPDSMLFPGYVRENGVTVSR